MRRTGLATGLKSRPLPLLAALAFVGIFFETDVLVGAVDRRG
jgi:hypothetical protein